MKPIVATVTSACLLLSSAGVVLADNPHNPVTGTGTKGQPGAFNGTTCGSIAGPPGTTQVYPGNGTGVKSPFNTTGGGVAPNYAGNSGNPTDPTGGGNANGTVANNSAHAVSEYDVACFQATQHAMP